MLKILCCVKQVPDVDQMRMDPETGNLIRAGVPAILNPLDANALSAAVKVKESYAGEITLITMGPPAAEAALRECLAVGADKAILVTDRAFGNADTLATSYVIASAAKLLGSFDLIFCGKEPLSFLRFLLRLYRNTLSNISDLTKIFLIFITFIRF